jgi:hypothetical protein
VKLGGAVHSQITYWYRTSFTTFLLFFRKLRSNPSSTVVGIFRGLEGVILLK